MDAGPGATSSLDGLGGGGGWGGGNERVGGRFQEESQLVEG